MSRNRNTFRHRNVLRYVTAIPIPELKIYPQKRTPKSNRKPAKRFRMEEEEAAGIAASAEFAEMPCYPYYGSTRIIGDAMVVKLS